MFDMTPKQKLGWQVLCCDDITRVFFDGGSRSGKTSIICEYMIMRALQFPGSRQICCRKHRSHAKSSLWNDTFKKWFRVNSIPKGVYQFIEVDLTIRFMNGSEIIIEGLDEADRVEKILGNEYITVFLNEATQLAYETMQMIITRLAQRVINPKGKMAVPKLITDCNPRGPRHWLYYVGVKHVDPVTEKTLADAHKWYRLNWSAYDNKKNLPEEFLLSLESLPEIMKNRMLHGIWVSNDGAVYDEFDEDTHVVDPFDIPADWVKVRSIDFGYTNPFVCLWGALDPDGRLYIYRELYQKGVRTALLGQMIQDMTGNEKILFTTADHDAGERAELEAAGIYTEAAIKAVMYGIQAVKTRLAKHGDGKPRLYIFSTLKNILSEMTSYEWLPSSNGRNAKDTPKKENDHAMDALRYMVMGCGDKFENKLKNMFDKCASLITG